MTKANISKQNVFIQAVKNDIITVTKNGSVKNNKTGKELGGKPGYNGYHLVSVKSKKTGKFVLILKHRLVWIIFKGNILDPELEVNHLDGNKSNNKLSNLELTSSAGNNQHAFNMGLNFVSNERRVKYKKLMEADKNILAKFSNDEVLNIRRMFINKQISKKQIMRKYGVCDKTARNLIRGKTYSSILKDTDNNSLKLNIILKSGRPQKYNVKDMLSMIQLRSRGCSNKQIAKIFNTHESTISKKISKFNKDPKEGRGFYLKLNNRQIL